MNLKLLTIFGVCLFPLASIADDQLYCPQKQGYINVGMSEGQVLAACGEPVSKQDSKVPVTQKVPVKQLIYSNLNKGSVYPGLNNIYDQWSLPSGTAGISLEVDIINNKVSAVRLNGSSTNAMSVCGGVSLEVGSDENEVYSACGNPGMVNNTYVNQIVPSNHKPQLWIYQVDQYQAPYTLTFVNGKLQSIDK